MKGTPFIYQGQEIGMTNVQFPSIDDYDDVSMRNYYKQERAKGKSHDEVMQVVWSQGRDNSRTPMQWSDESNGGFSTCEHTWMKVNPNYKQINVKEQEKDDSSILNYYRLMIDLRQKNKTFINGAYELCDANDERIYMYKRLDEKATFTVVVNLSEESKAFEEISLGRCVLSNYKTNTSNQLQPYEARVYQSL